MSRAERLIGFRARTSFEEVLRRTVAWHEDRLRSMEDYIGSRHKKVGKNRLFAIFQLSDERN